MELLIETIIEKSQVPLKGSIKRQKHEKIAIYCLIAYQLVGHKSLWNGYLKPSPKWRIRQLHKIAYNIIKQVGKQSKLKPRKSDLRSTTLHSHARVGKAMNHSHSKQSFLLKSLQLFENRPRSFS